MKIKLDYQNINLNEYAPKGLEALKKILQKEGPGNDFLGWVYYPLNLDAEKLARIIATSKKIRQESDVLVVVGIGGSYLGAKAALDLLNNYFDNQFEIIFLGNTLSSTYTAEVLTYLEKKDFSVNVISKSGSTTEPAIAFRLLQNLLQKKYQDQAGERIYVTTDPTNGILRKLADNAGWQSFPIPSDIGGRYSVLTAVGLLPIACAGIDIFPILAGAKAAFNDFTVPDVEQNLALQYAILRNLFYNQGKKIEIFASFEPSFRYFGEWLKQLFGESEGKDGKGLFPNSLIYSTDLHSMGQFVQDGSKIFFETFIRILKPRRDLSIPEYDIDDGLNYLDGKSLNYINDQALKATILAHQEGDVPTITLTIPEITPFIFGYLVYFFMMSCAISGHILGVNPFNQEGVEAYKNKMYALLGKEGYKI